MGPENDRVECPGGVVVAVGPDAELRIVRERWTEVEVVQVERAERVACRRHRDALVVVAGELAQHPAAVDAVVQRDRVAVVGARAGSAKGGKQQVARDGAYHRGAALVEDLEQEVDPLDVVVRADVTVGVRGFDPKPDDACVVVVDHALDIDRRGRHRERSELVLDHRVDLTLGRQSVGHAIRDLNVFRVDLAVLDRTRLDSLFLLQGILTSDVRQRSRNDRARRRPDDVRRTRWGSRIRRQRRGDQRCCEHDRAHYGNPSTRRHQTTSFDRIQDKRAENRPSLGT